MKKPGYHPGFSFVNHRKRAEFKINNSTKIPIPKLNNPCCYRKSEKWPLENLPSDNVKVNQ